MKVRETNPLIPLFKEKKQNNSQEKRKQFIPLLEKKKKLSNKTYWGEEGEGISLSFSFLIFRTQPKCSKLREIPSPSSP